MLTRTAIVMVALCLVAKSAFAQSTQPAPLATVDLWPAGKMPGKGSAQPEGERPAKKPDGYHRITDISRPTIAVFPARKANGPSPAIIVCPGGGYSYVVIDKEGTEIAAWLNAHSIGALVLKYRCPNNRDGALQDVQRSLSLARAHASEWNIDPKRVGVIGFSAGGNLAAKASNRFDQRTYAAIDSADEQSCRPDFAILVYPAYLQKDGKVAPDLNITANIPPTLIVHSEDDKPHVPGSKVYHAALDDAKVSNRFLLYPTGGHGYALHCDRDARAWPDAALLWMQQSGMR